MSLPSGRPSLSTPNVSPHAMIVSASHQFLSEAIQSLQLSDFFVYLFLTNHLSRICFLEKQIGQKPQLTTSRVYFDISFWSQNNLSYSFGHGLLASRQHLPASLAMRCGLPAGQRACSRMPFTFYNTQRNFGRFLS